METIVTIGQADTLEEVALIEVIGQADEVAEVLAAKAEDAKVQLPIADVLALML